MMKDGVTRRAFLGRVAGMGLAMGVGVPAGNTTDTTAGRLLHRIDCVREYPGDRYFSHGGVKVVESAAGRYREAEARPLSRFGYRFAIERVGKPHVAVIRYPDDKRRFMCIMDGTCYDLTTGLFTGWEQPLSGKMLELRQVFWPRWTDCSIVFMTWGEGEPAAASEIEIWELEDLPALKAPGDHGEGPYREIGIQYEDPCGCAASEGALSHEDWTERIVQYAGHTGQKLLIYPMAWYHGPLFPSEREASHGFDVLAARDRKQYLRWTTQPVDWYATFLDRLNEEGLVFQGALTLMRLSSLMEKMNIDLASIQAGADTFNNMMWNNQVQSSTNDWTWLYNTRNYSTIRENLRGQAACEPHKGLPEWAYGEHRTPGSHMAPMFNPLHPIVQEAILGFVGEIGQRYGKYPAFKGISFNMFASCMPWFGSIHAGYDDYTVKLFHQETGIAAYVDSEDPERFSQRYEYLTFVCRSAWVAWRCRKIHELFRRIREVLAAARPDLRVTVTLWDETVVLGVFGELTMAHQLGARQSMLELYRDAGIDPALYRNESGLELDLGIGNSRDRGGHGSSPYGGVNLPVEQATMYRDFNYLDRECLDAMRALDKPGAFIFNCWVEAWGRHVWFQTEPNDPNVAELSVMDGEPAEGLMRMNSEYPTDGFWWDSQLRITPGFPSGPHFLEPYAHALAEFDACRITRGGLFLDKAHSELIQRFAQAYGALPDRKFSTIGDTTDPVAVRTLVQRDRRYLYVVSRDYYPIEVDVRFDATPKRLHDLATGERITASTSLRIVLEPYGLRSLSLAPDVDVTGFTATPPPDIIRGLNDDAEDAFLAFEQVRKSGKSIPGMDGFETRMRTALTEGRLAFVRRTLTSYVVRKAKELAT